MNKKAKCGSQKRIFDPEGRCFLPEHFLLARFLPMRQAPGQKKNYGVFVNYMTSIKTVIMSSGKMLKKVNPCKNILKISSAQNCWIYVKRNI